MHSTEQKITIKDIHAVWAQIVSFACIQGYDVKISFGQIKNTTFILHLRTFAKCVPIVASFKCRYNASIEKSRSSILLDYSCMVKVLDYIVRLDSGKCRAILIIPFLCFNQRAKAKLFRIRELFGLAPSELLIR